MSYKEDLPRLEREPLFGLYVLADVHIGSLDDPVAKNFATGLANIKDIPWPADALFIAGDNSTSSRVEELEYFYRLIKENSPVPGQRTLVALGNHDVRGDSQYWSNSPKAHLPFWEVASEKYIALNREFIPNQNTVYYDTWINGYHCIVLNTEKGLKDSTYLSGEQLEWLKKVIGEKAEYKKPIFVMVHQPLRETHWGSNLLEGFGVNDQQVKDLLKAYPQTVILSGHIHNGFAYYGMVHRPYGTAIDIPSYSTSYTSQGWADKGLARYLAVYQDEIRCYPINLLEKQWYPEQFFSTPLPTLPVVYSKVKATERKSQELEELLVRAEELLELKYYQDPNKEYTDISAPPEVLFTPEFFKTQESMARRLLREAERK